MFTKKLPKLLQVFLIVIALAVAARGQAAPRYPMVSEVQGQVTWLGKDDKKFPVKARTVLVERAVLETGEGASIKVSLDPERTFTVLENSRVFLPSISWEGGEAPILILKSGRLRWQQTDGKIAYNVALSSDLFQFLAPKGDFVFSMYPDKAFAGVKVFKGSLEFSALNGEETAQVHEGQEVGFQGILEDKKIAYDILLKGKKIPRGRLTPVSEIEKKELAAYSSEQTKKQKAAAAKKAQEKKAREAAKNSEFICSAPPAKFNQCAWVCLNNPKSEKKACLTSRAEVSCVRRRCNANGVWAEETPVDAEKNGSPCKAQPVVAPCDY